MFQEEVAASQGIRIRRRPPTGPPSHYEGPLELRFENEGNTPRNILEEIVWNKNIEVSQMKERRPLAMLKNHLGNAPPARDFVGALKASYERTLIHVVKLLSSVNQGSFKNLELIRNSGVKGSFKNLELIRNSGVKCPLLCKEFVIDVWQIYNARVTGADAILLIAAVLSDLDLKYMIKTCNLVGLTALVEVHDEREMGRVLEIDGVELIGINNRSLETFEVDIGNTKNLLQGERGEMIRQKGTIVVGESGLFTPTDISYVQDAGVRAVLVGESIVKQKDPTKGITGLFGKDISV